MITRQRLQPSDGRIVLALVGLLALGVLCGGAVQAAPVTVGPVLISIPEGFEAAQTQRLKKTLISAWTKSVRDGSVKTLLQIKVHDLGLQQGKTTSEQDLSEGAERCLRQSMDAIERRRSSYTASPVARIRLADIPAARSSWNGALGPRKAVGVMYCVIVRNRFAVTFHTQDLGSLPSSGMLEAMKAIESVTVVE